MQAHKPAATVIAKLPAAGEKKKAGQNGSAQHASIIRQRWFRRQLKEDLARASEDTQSWGLNGY